MALIPITSQDRLRRMSNQFPTHGSAGHGEKADGHYRDREHRRRQPDTAAIDPKRLVRSAIVGPELRGQPTVRSGLSTCACAYWRRSSAETSRNKCRSMGKERGCRVEEPAIGGKNWRKSAAFRTTGGPMVTNWSHDSGALGLDGKLLYAGRHCLETWTGPHVLRCCFRDGL